jgi:hypothetical protein
MFHPGKFSAGEFCNFLIFTLKPLITAAEGGHFSAGFCAHDAAQ